jgi:hypothetical protein
VDELRKRWSEEPYCETSSASVTRPGRYYLLLRASGFMGDSVTFLTDFDDARNAAAFARYCLAPAALAANCAAPAPTEFDDLVEECFPANSRRLTTWAEFLTACEAVLSERAAGQVEGLERLARAFNATFTYMVDGEPWQLYQIYQIKSHGDLTAMLAGSGLLDEWRSGLMGDDPPSEHAELAALVAEHRLDENNPEHLALANEYFIEYPVILD